MMDVKYQITSINERWITVDVRDMDDNVVVEGLRAQVRFNKEGNFNFEYLHKLVANAYKNHIASKKSEFIEKAE